MSCGYEQNSMEYSCFASLSHPPHPLPTSTRAICGMENKILLTLSTDANILENDASIQLVNSSYMQLKELIEKSTIAKGTEEQIDKSRTIYKSFAVYAAIIYFTLGKEYLGL